MPKGRRISSPPPQPVPEPEILAASPPSPSMPEALASAPTPIRLSPDPPPKSRRDLDGFEYLASLSDGEWDDRVVYLYRSEPSISKADPAGKKFIAKLRGFFDEEQVREKFGGGKFIAFVKNMRLGGDAERKFGFEIEGAPRLQADEKFVTRANPSAPAVSPAPEAAAQSDSYQAIIRDLTGKILEIARESRASEQPEEEAVSRVAAMMQKANEASIEMMRDAAKNQAATVSGNPLSDRLIEAALTKMNGGGAEQLVQLVGVLKAIGLGSALQPQSPFAMLKELKDGLGIDVASLFSGRGHAREDWKSGLVSNAPAIVEGLGSILEKFSALQRQNFEIALATHRERARQVQTPQSAQLSAQPVPQSPSAPAVADASPLPSSITAAQDSSVRPFDFAQVRDLIAKQFKTGKAGDFAASLIMEMWPDHVPVFQALLSDPATLIEQAKADPVLAQIAADDEFPEFVAELVAELSPRKIPAA